MGHFLMGLIFRTKCLNHNRHLVKTFQAVFWSIKLISERMVNESPFPLISFGSRYGMSEVLRLRRRVFGLAGGLHGFRVHASESSVRLRIGRSAGVFIAWTVSFRSE